MRQIEPKRRGRTRRAAFIRRDWVLTVGAATLAVSLPGRVQSGQSAAAAVATSDAVRQAYQREFGETIERPAIFNDTASADCFGRGHLTTSAYLPLGPRTSRLFWMTMPRDASSVMMWGSSKVLSPAGVFRVLVVIAGYPETVGPSGMAAWVKAQEAINEAHRSFARARKYAAPIVSFENTNVLIPSGATGDPRDPRNVRAAAAARGFDSGQFDVTVSLDLDPSRPDGGRAFDGFVYMGNYGRWRAPIGPAQWQNVANAVYHHEISHLWGWGHDWAPGCRQPGDPLHSWSPFIAPPILFGWEDTDEDGVPEILDSTPYGRSQ